MPRKRSVPSESEAAAEAAAPPPRAARGQLHQEAADMLRKIILSGELAPGERLREVAISERLGMSRTPVREAFRTLAAEDLVSLLPNRSVVVSEVNLADTPDIFAVLGTLEALAGQYACRRMTGDQIDFLGDLQEELEEQFRLGDRVGYTETNRMIHELIVEGSQNTALIAAWRMLLPRVQRARNLNNLDRHRWTQAVREHRQIFDALAARDAAQLAQLMRTHFENGSSSMSRQKFKDIKQRLRDTRRRRYTA